MNFLNNWYVRHDNYNKSMIMSASAILRVSPLPWAQANNWELD